MQHRADLHTHTLASDGTCTPTENVHYAREAGLQALAITDHDTMAGVEEALAAGKEQGVEVIPGVEISTVAKGQDIHVLGYFLPFENQELQEELSKLRDTRHERNRLLIARLQELGIPISLEKVYQRKNGEDKNIGRPHIADELMELGVVSSMEEAFAKYLGKGAAAYVNPPRISPDEAIRLIKRFGGAAVLAHPGLYDDDDLVEEIIVCGLDGIEIWHPDNSEAQRERYIQLADDYGLIMTGGSDFHGYRGEGGQPFHSMLGSHTAEVEALEKLRKIAAMRKK